jgi:oxygen-independent coproporphyrinogen-3 oxidase
LAAEQALAVQNTLGPNDICLYVGIPFCPTRCAYCSFVSHAVDKAGHLLPPFLAALAREMEAVGRLVSSLGLRPVSVYIGGGTPTTLSPPQLDDMLAALARHFDLSALREYTVEAGRPDTVSADKLDVLARRGGTRVSVNPQSMQDAVLAAAGRPHTAQDVLDAFALARGAGLAVNMDLIAGLPGDTPDGFRNSLERVLALRPENVTIHTLAHKRGSRLTLEGMPVCPPTQVEAMLGDGYDRLDGAGYGCYYLYRQKYMAGQFENTGWAKPGCENLYNVCMMEELRTVLALGGGGVSKVIDFTHMRVERVFNPKYPYEYLDRLDEVIARKKNLYEMLKIANK